MAKSTAQTIASDPSITLQRNYLETAKAVLADIAANGIGYDRNRLRQWQILHNSMLAGQLFPAGRGGIVRVAEDGAWNQITAKNIVSGTGLAAQGVTLPSDPSGVQSLLQQQANGFSGAQSVAAYFDRQLAAFDAAVARAETAVAQSNNQGNAVMARPAAVPTVTPGPVLAVTGRTGPNWGLIVLGLSVLVVAGGFLLRRVKL